MYVCRYVHVNRLHTHTYLLLILLIPDSTYHLMPQSQSNNNNTASNNPHNNLARTRPGTEKEMSVGITII